MNTKEQLDTWKEICRKAKDDGFFERLKKQRDFLNKKVSVFNSLLIQINKVDRNKNSKEFNHILKLADKIEEIITIGEKKFTIKDGKTLNKLEKWLKDNYNK